MKQIQLWVVVCAFLAGLILSAGDDGLIGSWPLNEGAGNIFKDVLGNNNGEILYDMRGIKWVEGRNGKNPLFFGKEGERNSFGAVTIPGIGKYDFSKGITVSAWIKFSSTMKREAVYDIVSNATGDSGPGFRLMIHWGRLLFLSGDGKKAFSAMTTAAKFPFKAEIWYHVASTYDGSIFKVYVDGVKAGESEPDQKFTKGSDDISIGSYRNGYYYGFDGIVSDVKIYNKAISPLEIMTIAKGL